MARLEPPSRTRLAAALLLVALAFLAAYAYQMRLQEAEEAAEPPAPEESLAPIELDRFAARLERSGDEDERLTVSLRLRATGVNAIDCFLFIVARGERGTPKPWSIWPEESPGLAISAGGHFHAAHPASGHPLALTSAWQRVDAVLSHAAGQPSFDSVVVYVVSPGGNILLARPFAL
jgi:hypothetical protein